MKKYENPIPIIVNEVVSDKVTICFEFPGLVTQKEAAEGINQLIAENGGKLKQEWIVLDNPKRIADARKIWKNMKGEK